MSLSNERGSVVVLVAVMLFLIFFCVALVVDIGHIHNVKIELQRAVDAAALAGAQELPGGTVEATALAMVLANGIDKQVNNADVKTEVVTGWWNPEIIQGQRWFPGGTPVNAVYVKATLNVPHFFFFPIDDSVVIADAIAVAQTINPAIPLAVVSCIPTDPTEVPPGTLRDMTICGIRNFDFNSDGNDDGAWTSLTFNASATEINSYMNSTEGRDKFNRVIYGRDLDNSGIENTDVATPGSGCNPVGYSIGCGLGRIAGKDIARPDEFPKPLDWESPLSIGSTPAVIPAFDPLTAYAANGALPRWYNLNNDGDFKTDDHFVRIWSQDGILLQGIAESPADYKDRLIKLYDGIDRPFGDDRFANAGGKMVVKQGNTYKPDYMKILKQAGYPQVQVNNGVIGNVIPTFIDNESVSDGTDLNCHEDDALPAGQQAVILKTPVIFIGACDDWKAIGTASYVGMAKFLLTRAWATSNKYDCGSKFVNVGAEGCNLSNFDPAAPGGLLEALTANPPASIEGLALLPTADGEETNASLIRIYLVE
ncbi:MAG: hypothetical protein CVU69_07905 [Deltaproteobacteria bacterium HGW-Deltaproteobacteria-4]|nr:MAG: hypothetical protein CVU69_07905 [Deltaproteobacteria bacterium HGW-Deltaproteobacteria-4]